MDGLALCKKIRDSDDTIMILMLTAYSDELDLVVGLECGADDYVGKPFKLAELIARIRALLRRVDNSTSSSSDSVLSIGTLNIDSEKREVRFSNDDIQLTAKEFDVLWLLANNPSRVFSRSQILNAVWKSDLNCYESSINTIIKRIRRKCSEVGMHADFIETVRGVGYRFVAENAE
jgi:DNA-binding response OmpR family regulator